MSKLPNAPLIEVVFELRWKISDKKDLERYQYLHGDLFALVKGNYKYREALFPAEVPIEVYANNPAYRFRVEKDSYPLIQVGPGVITVNTIDEKYNWDEYESRVMDVISKFMQVHPLDLDQTVTLTLQYFDFLQFDFKKNEVFQFLKDNLNISIQQDFYKNVLHSTNLNVGLSYETSNGALTLSFNRGNNKDGQDGIVIRTSLVGKPIKPEKNQIKKWLAESHEFCSQLFKDMTKGGLYESFKLKKV
ncbi:TIGR04255 family protein [bacterium]|nr:MAG: TIGR04255 family protein [bacterium]